jgi:integrase
VRSGWSSDGKSIDRVPQIRLLAGEHEREFVLSRKDEATYLTSSPQPLRDAAVLMVDAGLRVGEALALEWSDVCLSPEPGFVQVRQGKSRHARRAVPLTTRSREMLRGRRKAAQSLSVFVEGDGQPMLNAFARLRFRRVGRSALPLRSTNLGCRVRFSGLRVFRLHHRRGISQRRL